MDEAIQVGDLCFGWDQNYFSALNLHFDTVEENCRYANRDGMGIGLHDLGRCAETACVCETKFRVSTVMIMEKVLKRFELTWIH